MKRELLRPPIQIETREYLAPSWSEMGQICFDLARKIHADGKSYDRLVTLAKGGWTWSRAMVDYLGIPEVASIQIKHYQDIGQTYGNPRIVQGLPQEVHIKGERILLFDDVCDTGKSLLLARNILESWEASSIDTAVLFHKPSSELSPDYYGRETSAWVIFPHEVIEAISQLSQHWAKKGINEKLVRQRLQEIGFDGDQIDFCLSLKNHPF